MDLEDIVKSVKGLMSKDEVAEESEPESQPTITESPFFEERDALITKPPETIVVEGKEAIQREIARYKTVVYEYKNLQLLLPFDVVNSRFGGAITEMLLLSSYANSRNKSYSVEIMADDNRVYGDNWDDFALRSNYSTDVTAFNDDDYYVLHFGSIFFESNIYIRIFGLPILGVTFDLIWIKTIQRI